MEDLNKKCDLIISECKEISREIELLKKDPTIIKYLKLCKEKERLQKKRNLLKEKIVLAKILSCDHLLVECSSNYDYCEGRTKHYFGCVKCGFDESIASRCDCLNKEEETIFKIMRDFHIYKIQGENTGIYCNLQNAIKIYGELVKKYPNVPEEKIISLFKKNSRKKEYVRILKKPSSSWDIL